ncbi:sugar ABC transporter substrate-binding protein [Clostridium magnum]|uniref:D-ribose-binding periplasmic protein n=1 Tax=Clostridium magnum DSM 2767 TaxID=1121326 RepID=A0A168DYZ4_9CLOT|nr:sugar ABC transporter substrate-binding protein [Clostridium magnum]KZL93460.1 D-ribose-binding periplasmic protein precursor [Clostridium magnum DSM 2767]SHI27564.1 monosaccharide ABC transporter substrate-binding protein, CUT2 family [Clostridium magnum DSM 2767]
MKRYGKLLSILAVTAVVSSALVGCGSKSTSQNQQTSDKKDGKANVAVVLKAVNSDYWKTVQAGAMDAGKELGVDVKVLGPNDETDIAGQTSLMEDQIVKKVSVLVVAPSQPSAALATFDKADQASIPVVLIDTDAKWDKKKSFVGTGNLAGGKLGGKYLAEKVGKGSEVVIIRGALGDATHDERVNGAKEELEAAGVKIVEIQPANSDRNKAMSVMENLLQTHPNVKGVFCSNDEMALGAERALKQSNKTGVAVVGFDGSADALKSIKAGELTASVAQSPYNIGKLGVETAVKIAKGEKVENRVDTGTKVISKENVDAAQAELDKILKK